MKEYMQRIKATFVWFLLNNLSEFQFTAVLISSWYFRKFSVAFWIRHLIGKNSTLFNIFWFGGRGENKSNSLSSWKMHVLIQLKYRYTENKPKLIKHIYRIKLLQYVSLTSISVISMNSTEQCPRATWSASTPKAPDHRGSPTIALLPIVSLPRLFQ